MQGAGRMEQGGEVGRRGVLKTQISPPEGVRRMDWAAG